MQSRVAVVIVALLALAGAAGPAGCNKYQPPTDGQLFVSRPQVFTRERLVDARLREYQWLENRLRDLKPEEGFQGLGDVRLARSFGSKSTFVLTPAAVAGVQAPAKDEGGTDDGGPGDGGGAAKAAAEEGGDDGDDDAPAAGSGAPKVDFASPGDLVVTTAKRSSIDRDQDLIAYREFLGGRMREKQLDDTHDLDGNTVYDLNFEVTVLPGSNSRKFAVLQLEAEVVDPTDEDFTEDLRAMEEEVQRSIIDDALALQRRVLAEQVSRDSLAWVGRTVNEVTLEYAARSNVEKFATAVRAKNLEAIRSKLAPRDGAYRPRLGHFQQESSRIAQSVTGGAVTAEQWEAATADAEALVSEADEIGDALGQIEEARSVSELKGSKALRVFNRQIARHVMRRYQSALDGIFKIDDPTQLSPASDFYASSVTPEKGAIAALRKELEKGKDVGTAGGSTTAPAGEGPSRPVRVLTIEPKEYVQNVSDVASRQEALGLALSVSALLGKTGTLANDTSYMEKTQELLHAIRRAPLAIGFGAGTKTFGWLVGPEYAVRDNRAVMVHRPVRHSVSASLVVPAHVRALRLKAWTGWVDERGNFKHSPLFGHPDAPPRDEEIGIPRYGDEYAPAAPLPPLPEGPEGEMMVVRLPGTPQRLVAALLQRSPEFDRLPKIEPYAHHDPARQRRYLRASRKPQALLVRGRDLWRNPQVFVGPVRADRTEVLSDMNGLLAYFDELAVPPHNARAGKEALFDLTVVTSVGSDTLQDAVVILPAGGGGAGSPFVRLLSGNVVADGQIQFAVDPALVPASFGQLVLFTRAANSSQAWAQNPGPERPTPKELRYTLKDAASLPQDAVETEADVRMSANGLDPDPKSVLEGGVQTFVRFKTAAAATAALAGESFSFTEGPDGLVDPSQQLTVTLPDHGGLFDRAFPGLAAAIERRQVRLTATSAGRTLDVPLGAATNRKFTVPSAQLVAAGLVPAAKSEVFYDLALKFKRPDGTDGELLIDKRVVKVIRKAP